MSSRFSRRGVSSLVGAGVVLSLGFIPLFAFADFTDVTIPAPRSVVVNIKAVVPGSLQNVAPTLAAGTPVSIVWQSDAQGTTPCLTNFVGTGQPEPQANSGTVSGTLAKTRDFVVICGGRTAKVHLTVGTSKLEVSGAGISREALEPKFSSNGKRIANTYIGNKKGVFQGTVRNTGNIAFTGDISTEFQYNNGSGWAQLSPKTIPALGVGKGQVVTYEHNVFGTDGVEYQFRFCAKTASMSEWKCSTVPGRFKFVAP